MSDQAAQSLTPQDAVALLFSVLSPNLIEEGRKLKDGESQLVHYTTAENAMNIIKHRQFWLRNVRCMNDYSEVQHGIGLLIKVFGGAENERIERLCQLLDQVAPGSARTAIDNFNTWIPRLPDITFIGCLSQTESEEETGRLSMWRAYSAPSTGVALVLDKAPFVAETDALKAYSLPVAYLTDEQFTQGIDRCLAALEQIVPALQGIAPLVIEHTIFWWLLCMAVGLKHPAFDEEREWRIIYIPEMGKSEAILQSVESIRGMPQVVQKIPLRNDIEAGLHGANPDQLLLKLIIGPTEFPMVLFDAFTTLLEEAGVQNAPDRIKLSLIPLR
jgi:Protein of unknown function (DUF2971)